MVERKVRFTESRRGSVQPEVSPVVAEAFAPDGTGSAQAPVGEALLDRVLEGLAEEIALMLDADVVERVEDVDLALILGAGFPRHRGGITPYLDSSGAALSGAGRTFHGNRFASGTDS